jgi:hypothetical protein
MYYYILGRKEIAAWRARAVAGASRARRARACS